VHVDAIRLSTAVVKELAMGDVPYTENVNRLSAARSAVERVKTLIVVSPEAQSVVTKGLKMKPG